MVSLASIPPLWKAHLCALVTALLWSFSFVCIRDVLQQYEAHGANSWEAMLLLFQTRIGLSAICFLPHLIRHRRRIPSFSRRDWGLTGLLMVLGTYAYHLPLNFGAQSIPSGFVSLIVATSPLFAAVGAAWLLREHLDGWRLIGLTVGLGGVALCLLGQGQLSWSNGHLQVQNLLGPLLVLAAAVAGAFFSITGRKLPKTMPNSLPMSLALCSAALLALPLWTPRLVEISLQLNARGWLGIVYLAGFCLYLASMLWLRALRDLDTVAVTIYLNATTVLAMGWGALLFDERFSPLYLLGAGLVIGAVILVNRPWQTRS